MKNLLFKVILLTVMVLGISLSAMTNSSSINEKPNIVVIKTDDQCWNTLSCYGDPVVNTPKIDTLADEGMRFENVFTAYAEVGRPEMPPEPMPKDVYQAYNRKRSAEDMFWFIEYTTKGRCASIRKDGWKYNYYNGDMEELYHFEADPYELNNLAPHPEYDERKKKMREALFEQGFVDIP